MRKSFTLGAALIGLVLTMLTLTGCDDVRQTGACSMIGAKHVNEDGSVFECVLNPKNNKGFWYDTGKKEAR